MQLVNIKIQETGLIRVGIVGATGYGGRELIRLLALHPETELVAAASTSVAGQRLADVLPAFRKLTDVEFETFDAEALAKKCDTVFIAVPGRESMPIGTELRKAGARVLDPSPANYTVELTGTGVQIDDFMSTLATRSEILAVVRSGSMAIARGTTVLSAGL